jgi:hypothetical protein
MSADQKTIRYRVYITPLVSSDTYGTAVDVSDRIEESGIPRIRRSIDAGDYDVGVYTYADINLKGFNHNGYFNGPEDSRSIFPYLRDRAKVEIHWIELDEDTGDETAQVTFRGMINDEATRVNPVNDSIFFKVLSRDSVIRNTKVQAGGVATGNLFSTALLNILSTTRIASVLTASAGNINPGLDLTVDDGSHFDNLPTRTAVNDILLVSNSVMTIDSSDNIIIKTRDEDTTEDIVMLYGPHDVHKRENIITMTRYNTGLHRMFNSVRFNTQEASNSASASEYGERQKKIEKSFITDSSKELQIAQALVDEFNAPKIELNVKVPTTIAKDIDLLDRVSIAWPLRAKPPAGAFLPVVGITEIGDTNYPLPDEFGSVSIEENIGFKVIEIDENPKTFETLLKLRQVGTGFSDGVFNAPGNAIVGFAVIGTAEIQAGGTDCDKYQGSPVGAAKIGCTAVS